MSPLYRFRIVALLEGASFLFLLFVAMPLKYWAGLPIFVRVAGMVHGVLFIAFVLALLSVAFDRSWVLRRSLLAFVSSLVPFGMIFLDRALRAELVATESENAEAR